MSTRLNLVMQLVESTQPLMPIAALLGIKLTSVELGQAVLEYDTDQNHANAMGTLHGGVLCAIADTAMGVAFYTVLEDEESLTTLELKINYLKPVWKGKLTASARVVKRGKITGLVECDILDEKQQLIARASSTYMAISGDQAANRMAPQQTQ
ncbi:MAG: PaaI family thioesterase [Desulfuromonadales bacterium]|nr:PaaI family thioesterase [Desulfuromonadales bacterium]